MENIARSIVFVVLVVSMVLFMLGVALIPWLYIYTTFY